MHENGQSTQGRQEFKEALIQVIPQLRAFAYGLCGRMDAADDLVQETMLKAWKARDSFEQGTSIKAWTYVILRNVFLSDMRRERFKAEYDADSCDQILSVPPAQQEGIHLDDMRRGLMLLPEERREAVLLVGAAGMSYEEAAQICNCAVGTIKSRVSRGRADLTALLADKDTALEPRSESGSIERILEDVKEAIASDHFGVN